MMPGATEKYKYPTQRLKVHHLSVIPPLKHTLERRDRLIIPDKHCILTMVGRYCLIARPSRLGRMANTATSEK